MTPSLPCVRSGPRAGFTLVEILAAFVILALFTVAIQRNVVAAAWNTASAQDRVGAEAVLATLLGSPLTGPGGAPGPASGALDGYAWAIRVEPLPPDRFGAPAAGEAPGWGLVRETVEVRKAGARAAASAEIIRLVRLAP